jgi:hypothetical protein
VREGYFTADAAPLNRPIMLAILVALAVCLRSAIYLGLAHGYGGLSGSYCHFDCGFYLRIAASGYGVDSHYHGLGSYPNWAYFPLFPMLIRGMAVITQWPMVVCGMVLTALALGLLGFAGALYIQRSRRDSSAVLWLLMLLAAPYGFFFSVPYTEAFFAALAVSVLLARAAGRPLLAAGLAALTAATRPTGILLSIIIIVDQLYAIWQRRRQRPRLSMWAELLPPLAVAPLGLTLFMAWQYWRVGDAFAFSHVQIDWDRYWLGPVTWIRLGLRTADWRVAAALFPIQSNAFNAAAALLGLGAAAWLAIRRRFAEAWICGAAILLPLSSGLHSMPRFVGTNPAFLLALYDALYLLRKRRLIVSLVLLLLAILQIVLLLAWYRRAGGLY